MFEPQSEAAVNFFRTKTSEETKTTKLPMLVNVRFGKYLKDGYFILIGFINMSNLR